MARRQSYSTFEISSLKDPASGGYDSTLYDKDIRAIVNAVKSSLPKDAYLSVGNKSINADGKLKVDLFVHSSDSGLVSKAISQQMTSMNYKGSSNARYEFTKSKSTDLEDKSLSRAEREEAKKSRKETSTYQSSVVSKVLAVVATLTTLTDVTRRILSTVMSKATEATKISTEAHGMGLSYEELRQLGHIETKAGIEKGSFARAISSFSTKVGNEFNIDKKTMESLGVLLGTDLSDVFLTELKGANKDNAIGIVLDKANELVRTGMSPAGQYVGVDSARVKMYNYLKEMNSDIADIFLKMQEMMTDANSIYKFTDYASMKAELLSGTHTYSTVENGIVKTLGQYTLAVQDLIERIKEDITVTLSPMVLGILKRIANMRWGLSEAENDALNKKNMQENRAYIASMETRLSALPEKASPAWDEETKRRYEMTKAFYQSEIDKAEKENANYAKGKDVASIGLNENEIQYGIGDLYWGSITEDSLKRNKSAVNKYYKETLDKKYTKAQQDEMLIARYGKSEKEIQKEINRQRAQVIQESDDFWNKKAEEYKKSAEFKDIVGKKGRKELDKDYEKRRVQALINKFGGSSKETPSGWVWIPPSPDEKLLQVEAGVRSSMETANRKIINNLTQEQIDKVFLPVISNDKDAQREAGIRFEEDVQKATTENEFYALGKIKESLNQVSDKMLEGVAYTVTSGTQNGVGGKKGVIQINWGNNDIGTLYVSNEMSITSMEVTATKGADGKITLNSSQGTSASSRR